MLRCQCSPRPYPRSETSTVIGYGHRDGWPRRTGTGAHTILSGNGRPIAWSRKRCFDANFPPWLCQNVLRLEAPMNPDDQIKAQKITPAVILEKKASHQRIACLTAYDYPTAKLVDAAGIDMILVGDTLSEVVLGNETTLPVTVDEMLHHTRAVRRAVRFALLIGDLPYGSYHVSEKDAVFVAMRFIKEAAVEAIKLEGGQKRIEVVRRVIAT